MRTTTKLRQLLSAPGIIVAPGCYDALTAQIIQRAGFECAYMSGGSIAATFLGTPDLALTTMTELVQIAHNICAAVDIPVIGDMETGFGSVLNVRRAMREYENSGLAGAHIEDQIAAKHCGHKAGKILVPLEEMTDKIAMAVAVRSDPDFVIIARCDAIGVEDLSRAIERGQAYARAGADVVYMEMPRTVEEMRALPKAIPAPLLIGQPEDGATPLLPARELEAMGFKIVTHPRSIRLMMVRAALDVLDEIKRTGTSRGCDGRRVHDDVLQDIVGTPRYATILERSQRSGKQALPV